MMKQTLIRRIYIMLMLVATAVVPIAAATPTAADILGKACQEVKKLKSFKASFTVGSGNQRSAGDITVDGNRFYLTTPDMTTWFDGKTQWSYSPAAKEVSVSEPTSSELEQVNPFAVVESLGKQYTGRRVTSPKGMHRLELTPKGKSDYSKVVLTLNAADYIPTEVTLTSTDRTVTTIKLLSVTKIKAPSSATFRFDPKKYPRAEIIDLR